MKPLTDLHACRGEEHSLKNRIDLKDRFTSVVGTMTNIKDQFRCDSSSSRGASCLSQWV